MIIKFILFALAAVSNALMDKLCFHYDRIRFFKKNPKFWNPAISWKNKYKNHPADTRAAFPGSKTVFIWLTDGWHFAKFCMLTFLAAAVATPQPNAAKWLFVFVVLRIIFGLTFTLFFHVIFHKEPKK